MLLDSPSQHLIQLLIFSQASESFNVVMRMEKKNEARVTKWLERGLKLDPSLKWRFEPITLYNSFDHSGSVKHIE